MNNLLKKLVDIDKEAQAIDNELRKEKENLEVDIQKEVQATKERYMAQAQQEIDSKVAVMKKNAETQWNENCKKYDISRSNLENNFNANLDKWVDTIVADTLS